MTGRPGKFFPDPPESSEPFFEAASDGKLLIQRCAACGEHQFYPRTICVGCGAPDVGWVEASGRARVHTFTVIRQNRMPGWADEVPYVVAVVDLAEGCRMTTNIVGCAPEDVRIDMPVEVTFVDEGPLTLPRFRPVG
jgi:hypothetical protein